MKSKLTVLLIVLTGVLILIHQATHVQEVKAELILTPVLVHVYDPVTGQWVDRYVPLELYCEASVA